MLTVMFASGCSRICIMMLNYVRQDGRPHRFLKKVKGKGQYICIAPYCRQPTSKALRYSNALSRDLTVLPAHPRVYPQMEWTIPAFAFPANADFNKNRWAHLPTPKGWKAELAWATRTVSKQSARDCYAMFIVTANWSKHHASLGKWVYAACPELLPGVVEAGVELHLLSLK